MQVRKPVKIENDVLGKIFVGTVEEICSGLQPVFLWKVNHS
jgi:hypothetical protein